MGQNFVTSSNTGRINNCNMAQNGELSPKGQAHVVTDDGSRGRKASTSAAHVLMIPYPSHPHILPMLDLAQQLASCGDIMVTFVSFQVLIDRLIEDESRRERLGVDHGIHLIGVRDDRPDFNPPNELVKNPIVLRESLQLEHNMKPFVQRLLQDRKSLGSQGPTCLVVDFTNWWSTDVAFRLGIPRYVLVVGSIYHLLGILSWHKNGIEEDSGGVIHLPGLPPLIRNYKDFPHSRKGNVFGEQVRSRWPKSVTESDGVLLNTCLALDAQGVDSMRIMLPENMPLMPVGPLGLSPAALFSTTVSMEGLQLSDKSSMTKWLDQQPPLSVLYVSFGTTGLNNLTKRHVLELATGLETSQQRFLWVLRAPPDVGDIAEALPQGFEERVKGRGLLLTGWAPQKLILAHPSTGAFLSSCGWNSAVESLILGVPIIGWPSFADQMMNCRSMEVVAKVAIELPRQEDHFVEAEEIKKAIRVMFQSEEGKVMRENAAKYKTSIAEALLAPRGSSHRAVQEFADLIRYRPPSTKLKIQSVA